MVDVQRLEEDLWMLDVGQFGVVRYGAVYVLVGRDAALVETSTSVEVPQILAGLHEVGVSPAAVRWIFVTHVHLDHAGGAGALLAHMPEAQVVVHHRGAKHLADPSRLLASVRRATGDMARHYGTADPIPMDRLTPAEDGMRFDLGGMTLSAVESPGHAPHHLCYLGEGPRWLFAGDAAGTWRRGMLLPTTPPPNFELATSLATLDRLIALHPRTLLYTHFGPAPEAEAALRAYRTTLVKWVQRVERAWRSAGCDGEEALAALLGDQELRAWPYNDRAPVAELEMCVRGVLHYLERREAKGA